MLNLAQKHLCSLVFLAGAATASAMAGPVDGDLLRLVPGAVQIVSGISDPGASNSSGRLLVVTKNNNLDFDDCLALLGVDGGKAINEVIEAAASSNVGDLADHFLLVEGHFNHSAIFESAIANGSRKAVYNGEQLLVVMPFDREKSTMNAVRWLVILKNKFLVFGVPSMVAKVLDRYQRNDPADTILLQRIARLHPDVNSWSIIAMPSQVLTAHLARHRVPYSLESILKDADEVELGIHYGRTARIDFSIHTPVGDFNDGRFSSRAQLVLATFTSSAHSHLKIAIDDQSRLHGWMYVSEKQFDQWLAALEQIRSGSQVPRGAERQ